MQFDLATPKTDGTSNNFNGTRFYSVWGETPWTDVTIPETGYTFKVAFCFEQFGNNASNKDKNSGAYNQRNHEIAIIGANNADNIANYRGDAAVSYPNYLFKLTQCQTGDAAGEGGWPTAVNGTCGFYINDETDLTTVAATTWYWLTLNVVGKTVNYDITDISGTPLKSGSYTLPEGADNRAGGMLVYGARYASKTNVGLELSISIESDEDVANMPTVTLNKVAGNDRIYKATFAEGETLHYVLPGGEEQEIDYWSAEDEEQNPGAMLLTCTQNGTLKVWTTKGEAKSEEVNIEVTTGWITLVDPVVTIASVAEGFGKSYTVNFNSAAPEHLLPVKAAITYTIDGGAAQEVSNGGTITMDAAGTLVVTVSEIPAYVGAPENYKPSSVTINNDVEYVCALDVQYINWDDTHFANNPAWESTPMHDENTSHWPGHWYEVNKYDKGETDFLPGQNMVKEFYNGTKDLPCYTLKNENENYNTELLPLMARKERDKVSVLLEEGIIANFPSYKNLEFNFDTKWVSDDAAKPNFMEIKKTNSYDRYDKGSGRHITDIVAITVPAKDTYNYYLPINDTAIHSARVFTYKGFNPPTGIEAIQTVKDKTADANAPIYNLAGQRVNKGTKGILIQNGKKFVVK